MGLVATGPQAVVPACGCFECVRWFGVNPMFEITRRSLLEDGAAEISSVPLAQAPGLSWLAS